jgi:riboflavin biosynthesis pyrimidine reductase
MTADRAHEWQRRFEQFAASKTRAALTARLSPLVTRLAGTTGGRIAVGNVWSRRLFDGPFYVAPPSGNRPACSLVFVQSADGNTGAADPVSLGGGATDTHLIYEGLSRVAADAVMAGAATVRDGNILFSVWHPEMVALRAELGFARHPAQIVATNRGLDLDAGLMFNVPSIRVVLLATEPALRVMRDALVARPWITPVFLANNGLRAALERLRAIDVTRISCIGGRTLANALLRAGLVDDVYLTTAPQRGGEPDTPIAHWAWRGAVILRKDGTGAESGVVFEQIAPAASQ